MAGLELGNRLGAKTGKYGGVLGGVVLIGIGVAVAAGVL
jgi:putative Mn2+ efflux pump MntP